MRIDKEFNPIVCAIRPLLIGRTDFFFYFNAACCLKKIQQCFLQVTNMWNGRTIYVPNTYWAGTNDAHSA